MSERLHRHNPAAHSRSRPTRAKRGGPSLTHRMCSLHKQKTQRLCASSGVKLRGHGSTHFLNALLVLSMIIERKLYSSQKAPFKQTSQWRRRREWCILPASLILCSPIAAPRGRSSKFPWRGTQEFKWDIKWIWNNSTRCHLRGIVKEWKSEGAAIPVCPGKLLLN